MNKKRRKEQRKKNGEGDVLGRIVWKWDGKIPVQRLLSRQITVVWAARVSPVGSGLVELQRVISEVTLELPLALKLPMEGECWLWMSSR